MITIKSTFELAAALATGAARKKGSWPWPASWRSISGAFAPPGSAPKSPDSSFKGRGGFGRKNKKGTQSRSSKLKPPNIISPFGACGVPGI